MAVEPILARIRQAREAGHSKITLLGGEPTLQPGFMEIVTGTVALGFEEIVLFTNGAKTARLELVDAIRATGGRFTWRISIQGANRESHERTTQKPGSFGRIVRTLENLRARGERATVNMCVVASNFEDVDQFPELLLAHGVVQLHLDMMRPLDAGERTEEELRATLPRYSALAAPFRRMIAGFPESFDVNIGNLPYCIAPDLAPWIHHDGEATETVAVDRDNQLSKPWNKYLVKRRDKLKPERCRECVLDARCSGVFETYADFYGLDELAPIDADTLRRLDPRGRLFGLWAPGLLNARLAGTGLVARSAGERAARVQGEGADLELRSDRGGPSTVAAYEGFTVRGHASDETLARLAEALGAVGEPIHPLGPEPARPALRDALGRLRARAPFGRTRWRALTQDEDRIELRLEGPSGEAAVLWLELADGKPRGGYRVEGEPSDALVGGLRAAMSALRERDLARTR